MSRLRVLTLLPYIPFNLQACNLRIAQERAQTSSCQCMMRSCTVRGVLWALGVGTDRQMGHWQCMQDLLDMLPPLREVSPSRSPDLKQDFGTELCSVLMLVHGVSRIPVSQALCDGRYIRQSYGFRSSTLHFLVHGKQQPPCLLRLRDEGAAPHVRPYTGVCSRLLVNCHVSISFLSWPWAPTLGSFTQSFGR